MSLRDEIEARIVKLQAVYDDHGFTGGDWDSLSDAEGAVFEIQPERLARMVIAWDCFLAFLDLQSPLGYDEGLLKAERDKRPAIVAAGVDLKGFKAFAEALCGLTNREAHAIFTKMEFWQVRAGLARYEDEPDL